MAQSPCYEAYRFPTNNFPEFYSTLKLITMLTIAHSPIVPILSQIDTIHILISHLFMINFK
jgi:hypothetical protein